jgi:hypothetical protein
VIVATGNSVRDSRAAIGEPGGCVWLFSMPLLHASIRPSACVRTRATQAFTLDEHQEQKYPSQYHSALPGPVSQERVTTHEHAVGAEGQGTQLRGEWTRSVDHAES